MSEIIGFSIPADRNVIRPYLALDDNLTKKEIIRRGWAVGPLYLPWQLYDTPKDGVKYYSTREHSNFRKDLEKNLTFKYEGQYYTIHKHNPVPIPLTLPYWSLRGATNDEAVRIIMAAMNAPVVFNYVSEHEYKIHWVTNGGERVNMTIWLYNEEDADDFSLNFAYETDGIPGLGYKSKLKDYVVDTPPHNLLTGHLRQLYFVSEHTRFIHFTIHYPNCELGDDLCASYEVTTETDASGNFIEAKVSFTGFYHEKVRRFIMPRFQPRTSTNTVSCYVLNRQEEKKFVEKLSSKTISDQVKSFLYGDGSDAILSLKWFYGIRPNISTSQKVKITLGNFVMDDLTVPVFAGDFTQVYMGRVFVRGPFQDYRDYSNARYQMYIPMLGHIDLNPSQVVGKNVHLIYTINLTDGSAIVTLATTENGENLTKTNDWYETANNIFTTSITYGYDIPLNVKSVKDDFSKVGEVVSKSIVGGAAGAIAGNVPGAVLGVAAGVASSNPITASYSSGSQTPNSNVMGDFTPKIYVLFNKDRGGDFSGTAGYPCGKLVKVGEASGFLKAAMVYGTPSTTMQHTDEIINLLKEGIQIS